MSFAKNYFNHSNSIKHFSQQQIFKILSNKFKNMKYLIILSATLFHLSAYA